MRSPPRAVAFPAREASFDGSPDYRGGAFAADPDDMQPLHSQLDLLSRLISAADVRHRAISQNIANVNTAGYRRLEVDFERLLADELNGKAKSASPASPVVRESTHLPVRADGNNVDLGLEIGELNRNSLLQQSYLRVLGFNLEQMRLAIDGG